VPVTGGKALFMLVRLLLLLLLLLLLSQTLCAAMCCHVRISPSVDHTQCTTTG
jgi:hypothetical protein